METSRTITIDIPTLSDLPAAAKRLISEMGDDTVFLFTDSMGRGKTTLIAETCRQLGVTSDDVSSPTFAIVNEYRSETSAELIYHFDCYRIESDAEAADMGVEDYFWSGALCFVEWPDRIENFIPADAVEVRINRPEQLPPSPRIIWIDETPSTHMLVKAGEYSQLAPYTMLCARRQPEGRGQRGNSWESEPYRNLTFSMPVRPRWVHPSRQFLISEAVAVAVANVLEARGVKTSVKWPNDIYAGDRKICGILIDHSLQGDAIVSSTVSAGVNVNQTDFKSDAPNPVSMRMVLGTETPEIPLEPLACEMQAEIQRMIELTSLPDASEGIHRDFMDRMWRNDGRQYPFRDTATGEVFQAAIEGVEPTGELHLMFDDIHGRTYRFKEVEFLPA